MADSCLAFRPQFTVLLEQCVNNSTIIHTKLNRLQGVNESRSTATHSRITELALYIVLPLLLFEIFGGCEFVCRLLSQVHVQKAKTLVFTKWMQWRAPSPKAYLANEIYQQHKTVVYAHSEACGPNEEEGPRSMHNDQQKGSSKLGSEAKEEMLRKQGRDLSGHIHGGQLPPDSLCCPILLQVFVNPVRTKYGHVFERVALEHWLDLRTECPLTRQPLSKVDICKVRLQQQQQTSIVVRDVFGCRTVGSFFPHNNHGMSMFSPFLPCSGLGTRYRTYGQEMETPSRL